VWVSKASYRSGCPVAAAARSAASAASLCASRGSANVRQPGSHRMPKSHFTIIRAKFDLPAGVTAPQTYVYHCHIVEHEDNDMMLAFTVTP